MKLTFVLVSLVFGFLLPGCAIYRITGGQMSIRELITVAVLRWIVNPFLTWEMIREEKARKGKPNG